LDDEMWEDVEDKNDKEEGGTTVPEAGEVLDLPMHLPPAEVPLPPEEEDEIL